MNQTAFLSIAATGFAVAFAHAAIPTHWLPFVLAGRAQRWSRARTLAMVALCGLGHVLFTTLLGALVVRLGLETRHLTGEIFPWIAGGALVAIGLYYLIRQARGGHGHHHFGFGGHGRHDQGPHDHERKHDHAPAPDGAQRIDTGHGVLLLDIDAASTHLRLRAESGSELPNADALTVQTRRADGTQQDFTFTACDGMLQSQQTLAAPHDVAVRLALSHGDHAHHHEARLGPSAPPRSDGAVIAGLFTLLTFSPCEGFLPVYLSGISYGWIGFLALSAVLSLATVAGMVVFTWLTLAGLERVRLGALERYEAGILGALILFLGVGIIFFGF